jgi:ribosome-associated protein YbcJ (S4-like RNA binding protein)
MGLKKREFTGTVKSAVMAALRESGGMSKRELLEALRRRRDLTISVRRVSIALGSLLKRGQVIQEGTRAKATFRPAQAA